jgi:hypothetical protein
LAKIIIIFSDVLGALLQGIIDRELIFADYKDIFIIEENLGQAAFLVEAIALRRLYI